MHNTPETKPSGHKGTHRKGRVPARQVRPAPAPAPTPRLTLGDTSWLASFRPRAEWGAR